MLFTCLYSDACVQLQKSAEKAYKDSKEKVTHWRQQIERLQTQTQHAANVLAMVEESSAMVIQDFFQEHQLYLTELDKVAVEVSRHISGARTLYCVASVESAAVQTVPGGQNSGV